MLLKLGLSGAIPALVDLPEPEPAAPANVDPAGAPASGSRWGATGRGSRAVPHLLFFTYLFDHRPPALTPCGSAAFPDSSPGSRADGGTTFAVSPDGPPHPLTATAADGARRLWIHALEQGSARELAGTDDAAFPFWSPDSQAIGFFARGTLKRIEASTGSSPVTLCDAPGGRGGAWSIDGVIVFAAGAVGGLSRVPAAGGTPSLVTKVDPSRRERSHLWPAFLPMASLSVFGVASTREPRVRSDLRG